MGDQERLGAGRLPRTDVWQAVRYMLPGVVAHKSVQRDGERIEVPDFGDPPAA